MASVVGLAAGLFATTNIDDVFVLLGFFADPRVATRKVVIGQFLGIAALFAASVIGSLASLVIPTAYIGLLGLAPIAIGLGKMWAMARQPSPDGQEPEEAGAGGSMLAVAAVTMANGGDNISIYTPLFAVRQGWEIAVIGAVFAVMTVLWLVIAHWLTHHRTIGSPIRRYGHRLVPFVLVGLGIYILHEAGSLRLIGL